MTKALIVVDVQNDFCEGGSLAVAGGARVAVNVSWLLRGAGAADYDHIVATKDHHIDPGAHWSDSPDFVDSWPIHCEVGTLGEQFHPELETGKFEAVFLKGEHAAAYSGFDGFADGVSLADWLRERDVTEVDVCGIATDYCVRATALDARREGFTTRVLVEMTAGVAAESTAQTFDDFMEAGVLVD